MPIRRLSKTARATTLKQIALFSSSSDRELRRIASVTTELHVEAGRVLTRAGRVLTVGGQAGGEFFVVIAGAASVWRQGVLLETVGPGSFFGEVSLRNRGEQTATVVSETDMRLLVLTRKDVASTVFSIPKVMERLLVVMSERLRRADEARAPGCGSVFDEVGSRPGGEHDPAQATKASRPDPAEFDLAEVS
jgi:CRP-like cAMP-binding protein